jgi:DNA polymerase
MDLINKDAQLKEILNELLEFKSSPLYKYRTENNYFPVAGQGNHNAKIIFIGEAPGKNEALTGKPFCGAAGKLLDKLLESAGINREDVYITNIVKDRPPENRDPMPEEIELYAPFLDRQIEIIQPLLIATLGRFSMDYIMRRFGLEAELRPISQIHGQSFISEKRVNENKITVIPLYHPAAAIYNQHLKDDLFKDFEVLKQFR